MNTVPPENQELLAEEFRIVARTYSDDPTPLAEVLVMLFDWSVERRLREVRQRIERDDA